MAFLAKAMKAKWVGDFTRALAPRSRTFEKSCVINGAMRAQSNAIDHFKDVISEIELMKAANANSIRVWVREGKILGGRLRNMSKVWMEKVGKIQRFLNFDNFWISPFFEFGGFWISKFFEFDIFEIWLFLNFDISLNSTCFNCVFLILTETEKLSKINWWEIVLRSLKRRSGNKSCVPVKAFNAFPSGFAGVR